MKKSNNLNQRIKTFKGKKLLWFYVEGTFYHFRMVMRVHPRSTVGTTDHEKKITIQLTLDFNLTV